MDEDGLDRCWLNRRAGWAMSVKQTEVGRMPVDKLCKYVELQIDYNHSLGINQLFYAALGKLEYP
jgi:hypothetical protein